MIAAVALACGYLVGSVPFAFLVARLAKGVDVRNAGSGNVGATNVLRTAGPLAALAVLVLDVGKGSAAVLGARWLGAEQPLQVAGGLAAMVGHVYPVWLRLHGGKGVATGAGAFALLAPCATGLAAGLLVAMVVVTRYASVGSVAAAAVLGPLALLCGASPHVVGGALLAGGLVIYGHRSNLDRLRRGTERRIGQRV